MIRLYESPGHGMRMRISLILLFGLVLLGAWYLVFQALVAPPGIAGLGPWFLSIAFMVAGIGGLVRTLRGARDRVVAMDMDEASGNTVIWLWSPFGARRIRTHVGNLANWRYEATGGPRKARFRPILADLKGRERPLIFDVRPTRPVPDGLRRVAPQAIADYERDVGIA